MGGETQLQLAAYKRVIGEMLRNMSPSGCFCMLQLCVVSQNIACQLKHETTKMRRRTSVEGCKWALAGIACGDVSRWKNMPGWSFEKLRGKTLMTPSLPCFQHPLVFAVMSQSQIWILATFENVITRMSGQWKQRETKHSTSHQAYI